jgi:hypothetical protein
VATQKFRYRWAWRVVVVEEDEGGRRTNERDGRREV